MGRTMVKCPLYVCGVFNLRWLFLRHVQPWSVTRLHWSIHLCHQIPCTITNEVSISKWLMNELWQPNKSNVLHLSTRQRHKQGVLAESILMRYLRALAEFCFSLESGRCRRSCQTSSNPWQLTKSKKIHWQRSSTCERLVSINSTKLN